MSADSTPITHVAGIHGNSGNSGNSPQMAGTGSALDTTSRHGPLIGPGPETDNFAVDVAREMAALAVATMQMEHGATPQATETAMRVLLLAAAEIGWDITIAGRGQLVSTLLLSGLDAAHEQVLAGGACDAHAPPAMAPR